VPEHRTSLASSFITPVCGDFYWQHSIGNFRSPARDAATEVAGSLERVQSGKLCIGDKNL